MKKLFSILPLVSSMIHAAEDMSSGDMDMPSKASDMVSSLSLKTKLMMHWALMSPMHKVIVLAVVAMALLWIVCKLMRHGKKCSCGCGGGSCGCHSK
jgi:hypothetical protein